MARYNSTALAKKSQLSLTLDRYQELLQVPIGAFNGLMKDGENIGGGEEYSGIWTQTQRDRLATFLAQAEEKRENEVGYFLAPKYTSAEVHVAHNPVIFKNKNLISIGEQVYDEIGSVALTLRDLYNTIIDPVIVTISTTTVLDADEIVVRYPGLTTEIHPLSVSLAADGTVTILIPRCRLVDPALDDDRENHLHYDTDANFLSSVEVWRCWYRQSTGAKYFAQGFDTFNIINLCAYADNIENYRLSIAEFQPATWDGEIASPTNEWALCVYNVRGHWKLSVNYLSGMQQSIQTELQTIHLAHTLMPNQPNNGSLISMYWQNDSAPTDPIVYTPYGSCVGAMDAWISDSRNKIGAGGMFR